VLGSPNALFAAPWGGGIAGTKTLPIEVADYPGLLLKLAPLNVSATSDTCWLAAFGVYPGAADLSGNVLADVSPLLVSIDPFLFPTTYPMLWLPSTQPYSQLALVPVTERANTPLGYVLGYASEHDYGASPRIVNPAMESILANTVTVNAHTTDTSQVFWYVGLVQITVTTTIVSNLVNIQYLDNSTFNAGTHTPGTYRPLLEGECVGGGTSIFTTQIWATGRHRFSLSNGDSTNNTYGVNVTPVWAN